MRCCRETAKAPDRSGAHLAQRFPTAHSVHGPRRADTLCEVGHAGVERLRRVGGEVDAVDGGRCGASMMRTSQSVSPLPNGARSAKYRHGCEVGHVGRGALPSRWRCAEAVDAGSAEARRWSMRFLGVVGGGAERQVCVKSTTRRAHGRRGRSATRRPGRPAARRSAVGRSASPETCRRIRRARSRRLASATLSRHLLTGGAVGGRHERVETAATVVAYPLHDLGHVRIVVAEHEQDEQSPELGVRREHLGRLAHPAAQVVGRGVVRLSWLGGDVGEEAFRAPLHHGGEDPALELKCQ